jgi:hypothetical protein
MAVRLIIPAPTTHLCGSERGPGLVVANFTASLRGLFRGSLRAGTQIVTFSYAEKMMYAAIRDYSGCCIVPIMLGRYIMTVV